MLKNYFKIALRQLRKFSGFTAINIAGLAVGMSCCFLIILYIQDELGYDQYHEKGDRIYRVVLDYETDGSIRKEGSTQGVLAPALEQDFAEIQHAVRLMGTSHVVRYGGKRFEENGIFFSDAKIFNVFSFPMLRGDPETALQAPYSVVLTEPLARKYFGDANPIGKTISADDRYQLTVTGVMAAVPEHSHFRFDALVSLATLEQNAPDWMFGNWLATAFQTYILLDSPASAEVVAARLPEFVDRRAGDFMRSANRWTTLHLEPLTNIYLRSDRPGPGQRGSYGRLIVFGWIAVFVLLIACINFMNLATARAADRARELGLRKVVGAHRSQLVAQVLCESMLLSSVGFILALCICEFGMPLFNELAGKSLSFDIISPVSLGFALLALVTGLLAGGYPAFVLSGLRPIQTLKGTFRTTSHGLALRRLLVILQFAISIALIAGTAIVYQQMRHVQSRDLGFDRERLLVIHFGGNSEIRGNLETIKSALSRIPGVAGVAASQTAPAGGLPQAGGGIESRDGVMQDFSVGLYMVDFDFVELLGIELLAGRAFSTSFATDSTAAIVLNETAVQKAGFLSPEDALGRTAGFWGRSGTVVGVVKDFHHYSLHTPIEPVALRIEIENLSQFSVRLTEGDPGPALAALEAAWEKVAPQWPFNYTFVDERFDNQYRAEQQFGRVFFVFAALAIFIACLGLFGLSAFTTRQRSKEIGVRKVLGANVFEIVYLLSGQFARLVLVALLIAAPLAWFGMTQWLQQFAYRAEIGIAVFAFAGITALTIALLTVGGQALRAATANPVDSLHYE